MHTHKSTQYHLKFLSFIIVKIKYKKKTRCFLNKKLNNNRQTQTKNSNTIIIYKTFCYLALAAAEDLAGAPLGL